MSGHENLTYFIEEILNFNHLTINWWNIWENLSSVAKISKISYLILKLFHFVCYFPVFFLCKNSNILNDKMAITML